MATKIKEWDYMGKRYRWTKKARHQGYIECTCNDCQKYVKRLVKTEELTLIHSPSLKVGAEKFDAIKKQYGVD